MSVRAIVSGGVAMPVKFDFLTAQGETLTYDNVTNRAQQIIVDCDEFSVSISDNNGAVLKVRNLRAFVLPIGASCAFNFVVPPRSVVVMDF